jgi:hypothetical protein
MRPSHHAIISAGLSAGLWLWLQSLPAAVACFLSGIFIDVDHYLDYWLVKKEFPWEYRKLSEYCRLRLFDKVYLVFHAHEWLVILWICIYVFDLNAVWLGLALGLTVHLIADVLCNPISPIGYSITYRIMNKFDWKAVRKKNVL